VDLYFLDETRFIENLAREGAKAEAVGKILSRREQEVLTLVIAGKTSREIADFYDIGLRTVEFHRANLMASWRGEHRGVDFARAGAISPRHGQRAASPLRVQPMPNAYSSLTALLVGR